MINPTTITNYNRTEAELEEFLTPMKKITLHQAHILLQNASGILISDTPDPLLPCYAELDGNNDNEFLYITWQNDDAEEYYLKFTEGANREIVISGTSMFLIDNEGEEVQITLLVPQILETE
jgi:hypothetical protein